VHLRRALLLFATVFFVAALAASLSSQTVRRGNSGAQNPPLPRAQPASEPVRLRFGPAARAVTRRLKAGRRAVVVVAVPRPGQVRIPGLGLVAFAEPRTPARFDVLVDEPRRLAVRYEPVGEGRARTLGTLAVVR
jgi:hypothetical protein